MNQAEYPALEKRCDVLRCRGSPAVGNAVG